MLEISPAGLAGAVLGTAVAAIAYGPIVRLVERGIGAGDRSAGGEERKPVAGGALLRIMLATDIVIFAGLGYWLGTMIGG